MFPPRPQTGVLVDLLDVFNWRFKRSDFGHRLRKYPKTLRHSPEDFSREFGNSLGPAIGLLLDTSDSGRFWLGAFGGVC